MASVTTTPSGTRTIQLSPGEVPAAAGKTQRPKISLGKVPKKAAQSARTHIETLCAARKTGTAIPNATADWTNQIGDNLRSRLEALGLVEPRQAPAQETLGGFIDAYIEGRQDIRWRTRRNLVTARDNFLDRFSADMLIVDFNAADAEDFRNYMLGERGLAVPTVNRRCGMIKQFFRHAVKRRIIRDNPFDDVDTTNRTNPARREFISHETIEKVIASCTDHDWRLIFALARYAGLRIPSEIYRLTWDDVLWDQNRFVVHCTKTENTPGKETRIVPIFPELLPYFQASFDAAEPGDVQVITRYGASSSNLRTQAHRIIRRAGVTPWGKTFVNLRSSRETELVEEFPLHVVTDWLGNSPDVARKHYLQITDEHFQRAASPAAACDEAPALKVANKRSKNGCTKGVKTGAEVSRS